MIALITNGLILTLMVGAIIYIYLVDLRVRRLLTTLKELEPMVGQFSEAVDRSETSLEKLKAVEVDSIPRSGGKDEGDKNRGFKSKQGLQKSQVGWVSLPGKSELVRSFFETARGQET
jgi:hypothetical protein